MRKLFINLFIFSLILIVIWVFVAARIRNMASSSTWKIEGKSDTRALFIGDSHIEAAINDTMGNGYYTMAESGDCFLYTYVKLKQVVKSNRSVKQVFLGIDCHSVDQTIDLWYSNLGYLNYKMSICVPYMTDQEINDIMQANWIGFARSVPNMYSVNRGLLIKSEEQNANVLGVFRPNNTSMPKDSLNLPMESKYVNKVSVNQIKYLDSIRVFCNRENIEFYLLTTPIHHTVPVNSFLESVIDRYAQNNKVKYYNYRRSALADSCFRDKYHLNLKGSYVFTRQILSDIN